MLHFDKKTLRNIFLVVAAGIVLYWILHETEQATAVYKLISGIFAPFVLGAGLAFVINVPMRSIENRFTGIKNAALRRTVALIITFIGILLVLALVFYLLIPQVVETATTFAANLPEFFTRVQEVITNFLNDHPKLLEWVSEHVDLEALNFGALVEKFLAFLGDSVSKIVASTFTAIGEIVVAIVNCVIGIVFALYCLYNKEILARQGRKLLYAYFPEKWSDYIIRVMRLTNSTFSNFLSGQCLEVCILGTMFAICMAIFQMPYIPLVSVLVAVTAFIPVVGAFVGCVLGAFFILVNNPLQAVGFVIMFLVLQQIENNVIYPRVVGTSIGLPGMWVLLAVAIGGELMGVAGMFLMIPLSSVLYALLKEITNARLEKLKIDQSKLEAQPPELRSHFKQRREKFKLKLNLKSKKKGK